MAIGRSLHGVYQSSMSSAAARFVRRTLGLLLAGVGVLAVIVATSIGLSASSARYAQALARERAEFRALGEVLLTMLDAETGQRGFLLTQDPDYLARQTVARAAVEASLARLTGVARSSPEIGDRIAQAERAGLRQTGRT